jgi:hypothetical protein
MTWIIMSPLLLTTFVFAVVPVLMGSNREDRLLHGGPIPSQRPPTATVYRRDDHVDEGVMTTR